jgi:hypothetical protein
LIIIYSIHLEKSSQVGGLRQLKHFSQSLSGSIQPPPDEMQLLYDLGLACVAIFRIGFPRLDKLQLAKRKCLD